MVDDEGANSGDESFVDSLKARYEEFIATLEEKGVPAPNVLVPVLALLVIVGLVAGIASLGAPSTQTVSIKLKATDLSGQPLSGILATLLVDGRKLASAQSDATGLIEFKVPGDKVPKGAALTAELSGTNVAGLTVTLSRDTLNSAVLSPAGGAALPSKVLLVKIRDSQSKASVDTANVDVQFDTGTLSSTPGADGVASFEVDAIPSTAQVRIDAPGYATYQKDFSGDELAKGNVIIYLDPSSGIPRTNDDENPQFGTLSVSVTSSGTALANAKVTLTDSTTQTLLASSTTDASGLASFDRIQIGAKFYLLASKDGYLTSAGGAEVEFAADGQREAVDLARKTTANTQQVAVTTLTKTGGTPSPQSDVLVTLYAKPSYLLVASAVTDAKGVAKFDVAKGFSGYVTAYRDGFAPRGVDVASSSSPSILLESLPDSNAATVTVIATKQDSPFTSGTVQLFLATGVPLGLPAGTTGADGAAEFKVPLRYNGQAYSVYASVANGPYTGRSDPKTVDAVDNELTVVMTGKTATITVTLKNAADKTPVVGAQVAAIESGTSVASCATNANGRCVLSDVPSETALTLEASADGFLTYTTSEEFFTPGERRAMPLVLFPQNLVNGVTASIVGLFDSNGKRVAQVRNGETYNARLAVSVAQNANQSRLYVRVGDKPNAQDDLVSISSFDAADHIDSSDSFTVGQCENDAPVDGTLQKWVSFTNERGFTGTREYALKLKVSKDARVGDKINLYYAANGVTGTVPALFPADSDLQTTLLQKSANGGLLLPSDFCTQKTQKASFEVSKKALICDEQDVCARLDYSDENGNRGGNGFEVESGHELTVHLEVFSEKRITAISAQSDFMEFTSIAEETTPSGGSGASASPAGTASAAGATPARSSLSFAAGDFGDEDSASRLFPVSSHAPGTLARLKLTALTKAAVRHAPLRLTLIVEDAEDTSSLNGFVSITGDNTFVVEISPFEILAGLQTPVRVNLHNRKTGEAITDADVEVNECDKTPLGGQSVQVAGDDSRGTGEDGTYALMVNPNAPGRLEVRARKAGYKAYKSCAIDVASDNFLETSPEVLERFEGDTTTNPEDKKGTGPNSNPDLPKVTSQTITVTNLLNAKVKLSASSYCVGTGPSGGATKVLKIFPESSTLKPNGNAQLTISVAPDITATADCLVHLRGEINSNFITEIDVPAQVNVVGPQPRYQMPGLLPLPNPIILPVDRSGSSPTFRYSTAFMPGQVTEFAPRGPQIEGVVSAQIDADRNFVSVSAQVPNIEQMIEQAALDGVKPHDFRAFSGGGYQANLAAQAYYYKQLGRADAGLFAQGGGSLPSGSGFAQVGGVIQYQNGPAGSPSYPLPVPPAGSGAYPQPLGVPSYGAPAPNYNYASYGYGQPQFDRQASYGGYSSPNSINCGPGGSTGGGAYGQYSGGTASANAASCQRFPLRGRIALTTDKGYANEYTVVVVPTGDVMAEVARLRGQIQAQLDAEYRQFLEANKPVPLSRTSATVTFTENGDQVEFFGALPFIRARNGAPIPSKDLQLGIADPSEITISLGGGKTSAPLSTYYQDIVPPLGVTSDKLGRAVITGGMPLPIDTVERKAFLDRLGNKPFYFKVGSPASGEQMLLEVRFVKGQTPTAAFEIAYDQSTPALKPDKGQPAIVTIRAISGKTTVGAGRDLYVMLDFTDSTLLPSASNLVYSANNYLGALLAGSTIATKASGVKTVDMPPGYFTGTPSSTNPPGGQALTAVRISGKQYVYKLKTVDDGTAGIQFKSDKKVRLFAGFTPDVLTAFNPDAIVDFTEPPAAPSSGYGSCEVGQTFIWPRKNPIGSTFILAATVYKDLQPAKGAEVTIEMVYSGRAGQDGLRFGSKAGTFKDAGTGTRGSKYTRKATVTTNDNGVAAVTVAPVTAGNGWDYDPATQSFTNKEGVTLEFRAQITGRDVEFLPSPASDDDAHLAGPQIDCDTAKAATDSDKGGAGGTAAPSTYCAPGKVCVESFQVSRLAVVNLVTRKVQPVEWMYDNPDQATKDAQADGGNTRIDLTARPPLSAATGDGAVETAVLMSLTFNGKTVARFTGTTTKPSVRVEFALNDLLKFKDWTGKLTLGKTDSITFTPDLLGQPAPTNSLESFRGKIGVAAFPVAVKIGTETCRLTYLDGKGVFLPVPGDVTGCSDEAKAKALTYLTRTKDKDRDYLWSERTYYADLNPITQPVFAVCGTPERACIESFETYVTGSSVTTLPLNKATPDQLHLGKIVSKVQATLPLDFSKWKTAGFTKVRYGLFALFLSTGGIAEYQAVMTRSVGIQTISGHDALPEDIFRFSADSIRKDAGDEKFARWIDPAYHKAFPAQTLAPETFEGEVQLFTAPLGFANDDGAYCGWTVAPGSAPNIFDVQAAEFTCSNPDLKADAVAALTDAWPDGSRKLIFNQGGKSTSGPQTPTSLTFAVHGITITPSPSIVGKPGVASALPPSTVKIQVTVDAFAEEADGIYITFGLDPDDAIALSHTVNLPLYVLGNRKSFDLTGSDMKKDCKIRGTENKAEGEVTVSNNANLNGVGKRSCESSESNPDITIPSDISYVYYSVSDATTGAILCGAEKYFDVTSKTPDNTVIPCVKSGVHTFDLKFDYQADGDKKSVFFGYTIVGVPA